MKKYVWLLSGLFFSCVALAQVVAAPTDLGSAAAFLPAIISFFKNGNYLAAGALISLILTWAINAFVLPKINLPGGILPIVAAVLGIVSGVGLAVANGGTLGAATMAVLSGPAATFLWEAIIKYLVPVPASPAPSAPPAA